MKRTIAFILSVAFVFSLGAIGFSASATVNPSVEIKEAPEVVAPSIEIVEEELPPEIKKEEVAAVIKDKDDQNIYIDHSTIVVVSLADAIENVKNADETETGGKDPVLDHVATVSKELVKAYNEVKAATHISEKVAEINEVAADLGFEEPVMAVTSMFEVNPGTQEHQDALAEEGATITISFANTMGAVQGGMLVAHMVEEVWKLVDPEKVVITPETITVEFDNLCPVMFISVEEKVEETTVATESETVEITETETETVTETETEVESESETEKIDEPKKSNALVIVIVVVVVVAAAAVVVVVVLKKKKGAKA